MGLKIVLTKKAAKDLEGLGHEEARRIVQKMLWLEKQTDPLAFAKHLRESATGDVRFRIGEYRLIALINRQKKQIEVVQIGHRREIYKNP